MTKPKLTIQKRHESKGYKPCYIDAELHSKIKDLSNETHVPLAQIIDKFIRYGLKYVEIVEPPEDAEIDNEK